MSLDLTTATDLSAPISVPYAIQSEPAAPGSQEAPLRLVIAALRGRYHWAAILATLFATVAAVMGWFSGKPLYRSGVPIRVAPILQRVLYADEEKGQLPAFDRFVETQIALMQSQRVIEGAVDRLSKDEGWRRAHVEAGANKTDNTILQLSSSLSIIRNNELVMVYVLDPDPKYATLGAQAIVDTFHADFVENDTTDAEKNRLSWLQQYQTVLDNDLKSKREQISIITAPYGTQNVDVLSQDKLAEVARLQAELANLQLDLALVDPGTKAGEKPPLPSKDQLMGDVVLQNLTLSMDKLQEDLADMSAKWGPKHSQIEATQSKVERLKERIDERVKALQNRPQSMVQGVANAGKTLDAEQIKMQIAKVDGLLKTAKEQMFDLFKVNTQVGALREQTSAIDKNIEDARNRIAQLNLESRVGGRITVLGEAERPLQSFSDNRRKLAATGAAGGAFGGVMLVVMFGLLDRRLRHADEIGLRLGLNQILGMLPTLPGDLSNPEQAAIAAHAVHHIRTMLQIRARDRNSVPILVVTSPAAGTGKTSLVLGLGLSFASTGSRTLLIDCDLIGGGLTTRMNAIVKRKLGRILVERKLITEAQLQTALRDTEGKNVRLGERLVEMRCLKKEDLDDSLRIQSQSNAGLVGALRGEPLNKCVVKSGLPGLWVLPLSDNDTQHASSLSPTAIGALFKEARRHFDTILIDTGPVPGSLEASVVAAQADGVLAIISRGESSRIVGRCLDHLRTVGATMMGIVFNRANEADMATRGTTKRISSTLRASRPQVDISAPPEAAHRGDFGPVARAVATSASSSSNGSRPSSAAKNGKHK